MEATTSLKERILNEATRLFAERGYDAISMREIAEALHVSKAALYYHYENKEALMLAILMGYLEEIDQIIDRECPPHLDTHSRIANLVNSIFRQPPEQRAVIRLASQEMPLLNRQTRQVFGDLYHKKFIGKIEAILAAGIERGELRSLDVKAAAWILLGMMYPFFYSMTRPNLKPEDPEISLMIDLFLNGAAR